MRKLIETEGGKKAFIDPDSDLTLFYDDLHIPKTSLHLHKTVSGEQIFYLYYKSNNVVLCEILEPERALKFVLDNWSGEFTDDDILYYKQFFPFFDKKVLETYYSKMNFLRGE
ncbi:MAG: hypothetical protein QXP36_14465 [Conexivisphaerales archaeon]